MCISYLICVTMCIQPINQLDFIYFSALNLYILPLLFSTNVSCCTTCTTYLPLLLLSCKNPVWD